MRNILKATTLAILPKTGTANTIAMTVLTSPDLIITVSRAAIITAITIKAVITTIVSRAATTTATTIKAVISLVNISLSRV